MARTAAHTSKLLCTLAVACALVSAASGAWAGNVVGTGDFAFYLDTAAFRGRDGRVLAEVNVRIPNNELKFNVDDGVAQSRVKLSVLITDADGKPVVEDAEKMTFRESDVEHATSSLFFQTVIKRYHIKPGVYQLSYAIEDLNAVKRTLVGLMQGKNMLSSVRDVRLDLPEMRPEDPAFSQAKFLWDVGEERDGRREYHPNPPRLYGLYKDSLMVYMELYLPDEMAREPGFAFRSAIVNAKDEELDVTRVELPDPGPGTGGEGAGGSRTYPLLLRQDLARYPAGTYALHVSFFLGERRLSRIHAGNFSIAWDLRTWEVPRREMLAEARFLLGDKAYEEFAAAPVGEQERTLDQLWKSLDPTPETEANEAYETFISRLAFASEHYSDFGPAVVDQRGEIYIRLGPPDEIVQDVIPLNRETVGEALQVVEDPFHTMSLSSHSAKIYSRTASRNTIVDPRGLSSERAGDNVGYPFELWVYTNNGSPLLPRDAVQEIDIGMRYLFVDRRGYGRYKLESSSSISNK